MNVIAPGITDEDYFSKRVNPIDIFEGRIKEWTLGFANELALKPHSGVAVLILAASVLEPMGGALLGTTGNTERRVVKGLTWAFPSLPAGAPNQICDLLRDGLFHKSFIKAGLVLQQLDNPIKIEPGGIFIDPNRFLKAIDESFSKLCAEIRSRETAAFGTFEAYWEKAETDELKYHGARFAAGVTPQSGVTLSTAAAIPKSLTLLNPDGSVTKIE